MLSEEELSHAPPFTVLGTSDQPKIIAARPPYVRQGAETTLFIDLQNSSSSETLVPTVDIGDAIFVESVVRRGTGLDVEIVVAANAPLGDLAITVDEGSRILSGVELEVRDSGPPTQKSCSQAPRLETLWWLLAPLILIISSVIKLLLLLDLVISNIRCSLLVAFVSDDGPSTRPQTV